MGREGGGGGERETDRWMGREGGGERERQIDRQTDRQTDRERARQTKRQADRDGRKGNLMTRRSFCTESVSARRAMSAAVNETVGTGPEKLKSSFQNKACATSPSRLLPDAPQT